MLHRAIGAVLAAASDAAVEVAAALSGDYASGAKAHCDWDDPRARQELVDRLGADAAAVLAAIEGRELRGALSEAAELLAAVAGQDLCQDRGGLFMIARRVAKTGSCPLWIPTPVTATRAPRDASTATRATPQWTQTPN